jgi:hypothetical protein
MATPTYVPLATITLESNDAQITFANIPGTYRDLVLVANITGLAGTPTAQGGYMRVNGVNSGYTDTSMYNGGGGANLAGSGETFYPFNPNPGIYITQFMGYSATDRHKIFLTRANAPAGMAGAIAHRWANNAAITSITLFSPDGGSDSFNTGSRFSLYGIHA